jgi:hydrogenase nickel incorporation protein HypB
VCPASFDLGHHRNVTLLSVTEGDDKPAKYPVMFRGTDLLVLSKSDLLPSAGGFRSGGGRRHLRALASRAPVMALSARKGIELDAWLDWLRAEVRAQRERLDRGDSLTPGHAARGRAPACPQPGLPPEPTP